MKTRIYKQIFFLFITCVFLFTSLIANSITVAENANSLVNIWNKDVTLTDTQKTAVLSLATSFVQKCDSINQQKTVPFDQREALKAAAHKAYLSSVEKILTTTQKQRLAAKKAERANILNAKVSQQAATNQAVNQSDLQSTQQSNQ